MPIRHKLGDQMESGHTIATILGQSDRAIVYTTNDNHLRWNYYANHGTVPANRAHAIETFDRVMSRIGSELPKAHRAPAYVSAGKALFLALDTSELDGIDHAFDGVLLFINERAKQFGRFVYTLSALITLGVVFACLGFFARTYSDLNSSAAIVAVAGICGAVGSSISILQRGSSLVIDPNSARYYLILQGSSRAVLGCIFGGFFALINKANLLLGVMAKTPEAVLAISVVAGFSERFVPELMAGLEAGIGTRSRDAEGKSAGASGRKHHIN